MALEVSRLGISSIAWSPQEDESIARLLREKGIGSIDLAPSKYAPWGSRDLNAILKAKLKFWSQHKIRIRGFQSLLYGAQPMNILKKENWFDLFEHFEKVFEAADLVGAEKLVFGSPKSRVQGNMSLETAMSVAAEFLSGLADLIGERDIQILFEPNPEVYGCDFVTNSEEAAKLIARVARPQIKMNLDLGTSLIEGECVEEVLIKHTPAIGYVHLSTENLKGLADAPNTKILDFLALDTDLDYSIEQNETERGLASIQESLDWLGVS